jgi:hypothetical protein
LTSKKYQGLAVQDKFLDGFYVRSQDFAMANNEDNALFIVKIEKGKTLIEQLMTDDEKKKTGLSKLTPQELAELNAFLDPSLVVAPGPIHN